MWGKWLVAVGLFVGVMHVACAEEAVLNNPPAAVSKITQVVNALSPGFDTIYNVRDGEWTEGWSSNLWTFKSKDYHLASWRVGYGHEQLIYSSVKLDLPSLSYRFIPATVRGIATTGYLHALWDVVGKYGSIGPFIGYQFGNKDAVAVGLTLGGQVSF